MISVENLTAASQGQGVLIFYHQFFFYLRLLSLNRRVLMDVTLTKLRISQCIWGLAIFCETLAAVTDTVSGPLKNYKGQ